MTEQLTRIKRKKPGVLRGKRKDRNRNCGAESGLLIVSATTLMGLVAMVVFFPHRIVIEYLEWKGSARRSGNYFDSYIVGGKVSMDSRF